MRNTEYDADAPRDSPCCQPIIITKPERLVSFDETRIELDMTRASKAASERIVIVREHGSKTQRATDCVAHKGGLAGTGVGGSLADSRSLPALFIACLMVANYLSQKATKLLPARC